MKIYQVAKLNENQLKKLICTNSSIRGFFYCSLKDAVKNHIKNKVSLFMGNNEYELKFYLNNLVRLIPHKEDNLYSGLKRVENRYGFRTNKLLCKIDKLCAKNPLDAERIILETFVNYEIQSILDCMEKSLERLTEGKMDSLAKNHMEKMDRSIFNQFILVDNKVYHHIL